MDENAVDARSDVPAAEVVRIVDGVEVASLRDVVARLLGDYPGEDATRVETVVLREWEAFSAGRPLVVPVAVEEGAREILDQSRA